jgi:hypothetical protein
MTLAIVAPEVMVLLDLAKVEWQRYLYIPTANIVSFTQNSGNPHRHGVSITISSSITSIPVPTDSSAPSRPYQHAA